MKKFFLIFLILFSPICKSIDCPKLFLPYGASTVVNSNPITLETLRLKVKAISYGVFPSLYELLIKNELYEVASTEEVSRFFGIFTEDYFIEKLKMGAYVLGDPVFLTGAFRLNFAIFKVEESQNLEPIGYVFLEKSNHSRDVELGYFVDPNEQKNGYATEAILAVVSFARLINIKGLAATVFANNEASIRILEKIGMQQIISTYSFPSNRYKNYRMDLDP